MNKLLEGISTLALKVCSTALSLESTKFWRKRQEPELRTWTVLFALISILVGVQSDSTYAVANNNSNRTFKTEEAAMEEVGRQISSQLKNNRVNTVFVRHFRGPGTNELQLTNLLIQALDNTFQIGPGGVEVEGRIRPLQGSGNGPPAGYRISVDLEGPDDSITYPGSSVDVTSEIDGHLKLKETEATRPQPPEIAGKPFEDVTRQKPQIEQLIKGTRIYPHPSSPYSMELLIKDESGEFKPRKPFVQDGVLVVNLERGETYKVRVYNDSIYESFAKLNIDGLSRFALSYDTKKRRNIDLVKRHASRDFVGYFLDGKKASSFVVGEYEESVAKRILGDAPDVGTISVAFGCTYTGQVPEYEKETKTVTRQETTTIMVPQIVQVPRVITENVPAPNQPAPTSSNQGFQNRSFGNTGNSGGRPTSGSGGGFFQRQRTVYEQKTVMVPRQRTQTITEQQVVGTTEGPAVDEKVHTVSRKFGLTRAVIKLRYFATKG